MHDQPNHSGGEAARPQPARVGHRPRPSDRRERALVAVAKRACRAAGETLGDQAAGVTALLHRDGRDAWKGLGLARARVTDANHVADRKHLGMPGKREIRLDRDAAGAVDLRAGRPRLTPARVRRR